MEIRHSSFEDLDTMLVIYERARAFMKENGNYVQWGPTNWPPKDVLIEDIQANRSYVCVEDGKVIGAFCFMYGKDIDATYLNIEAGNWHQDKAYGVVHRIASDGTKGVGTFCLNWAYEKAGYVRIDTHPNNTVMQNLLKKLGFNYCGIIHVVEDNDPRYAFDK